MGGNGAFKLQVADDIGCSFQNQDDKDGQIVCFDKGQIEIENAANHYDPKELIYIRIPNPQPFSRYA